MDKIIYLKGIFFRFQDITWGILKIALAMLFVLIIYGVETMNLTRL